MTGDKLRLQIRLSRQELGEWARLAKRCSTTRQLVGAHAVRQFVAHARAAAMDVAALPGPAERTEAGAGEAIFLNAGEAAELVALAASIGSTPDRLAVAAIRLLLAEARRGIVPLVRPLPSAGGTNVRYETYSAENAADNNYTKAMSIIDVLVSISERGLTPDNRAELARLEAKETVAPVGGRRTD